MGWLRRFTGRSLVGVDRGWHNPLAHDDNGACHSKRNSRYASGAAQNAAHCPCFLFAVFPPPVMDVLLWQINKLVMWLKNT